MYTNVCIYIYKYIYVERESSIDACVMIEYCLVIVGPSMAKLIHDVPALSSWPF